MMLANLAFSQPLALWALLGLPLLWWLLRFIPPRPETVRFPPFRLLLELTRREERPRASPLWLLLLRLALAALLILAAAGPHLRPQAPFGLAAPTRLIILDDSWAAARDWPARLRAIEDALQGAESVSLALTTPASTPQDLAPQAAQAVLQRVRALKPRALASDRLAILPALAAQFTKPEALDVIWLSDGMRGGDDAAFATALTRLNQSRARLTLLDPAAPAPAITGLAMTADGFRVRSRNAAGLALSVLAGNGRVLAQAAIAGEETALTLPLEFRNVAASLKIAGESTAGATRLLDDRARRKRVGLVAAESLAAGEPLLAPLYYAERALEPFAELAKGPDATSLLSQQLSMLVLADSHITTDAAAITTFVEEGGLLLRFAGSRLAEAPDGLLPVTLRAGMRNLSGSLGWEAPQGLAPFPAASPFAGLAADPQIRVRQQLLAEPDAALNAKSWAVLADGTPLITATRRGKGLIVLVHVTANPGWSNLPLSGLYVELLQRLVDLAPGIGAGAATPENAGAAFTPAQALDGFGDLTAMPPEAQPIPAAWMDAARPTPSTPAGFYVRGSERRALNLDPGSATALQLPGTPLRPYASAGTRPFTGLLLAACLLLLALDNTARLWLHRRAGPALALLMIACIAAPQARAQGLGEPPADTTLAYVRTGDAATDNTSAQGLAGLGRVLQQRTAVEPGEPQGLDMETDELAFYPLIYWPVLPDAPELSPEAARKLARYMRQGGLVFFDTRDADTGNSNTPALQAILARLDVPALSPVPHGHALGKSFYLLKSFPGRLEGGSLWVETNASPASDNVSGLVIGANDYAAAWATDADGHPLHAVSPGGEAQREIAYRVGVNVVMYALTGNYKADQVHVPALLERLGP